MGNLVIEELKTVRRFSNFQLLTSSITQSLSRGFMYHYDPNTALEELTEDATLPNPVHVRDMILRKHPSTEKALELNRLFLEYQKFFGEAQKLGKEILKQLAA
ncbi:MAG: hypothetical protein DMG79_19700 [Acidobacteria bacterium]|nr:MAG: hypothetical protein DMG79_19700 [Acidobacteriota bacterium]